MFCWVGLFGHSFFNTVFVYNQSKCWYSIIHCVKYVKSQGFSFSSNNDLFFVQHVGAQENYYLFFLLNLNVSDDGDENASALLVWHSLQSWKILKLKAKHSKAK